MTPGTPIVVIGDDWGRQPSTTQHLFRRLLGRHPIVWVNGFGHRLPTLSVYDVKRAASKVSAMFRPSAAVTGPAPDAIIHPKALPWHHVSWVHAMNTASLRRDITRALSQVAPGRPPLLVTGTPIAWGLVGEFGALATIYLCIDDHAELPNVTRDLVAPHEAQLLQRVDAVIATAQALVEKKRPASGRAFYLPQGVNYEHFAQPRPVPPELAVLPKPIIGFAGGVSPACDLDMVVRLAEDNPGGSVVLVGPVSVDVTRLALPNVHLLGSRSYDELPGYVQAFDVGIIPYVLNDWTRAVDPLKLLEYLAAGIPVVATPLPEVAKYAAVVRIAGDPDAFSVAVEEALTAREGDAGRGQDLAREHTWEVRAAEFLRISSALVSDNRGMRPSPGGRSAAPTIQG